MRPRLSFKERKKFIEKARERGKFIQRERKKLRKKGTLQTETSTRGTSLFHHWLSEETRGKESNLREIRERAASTAHSK